MDYIRFAEYALALKKDIIEIKRLWVRDNYSNINSMIVENLDLLFVQPKPRKTF